MKTKSLDSQLSTNLILIHGWGMDSIVFESVAQRFSDIVNVVYLDLPGYGINHELNYTYQQYGEFLRDLDSTIPQNSIILGWSLGGLIALDYACHYQKKLKGLITVCSSPRFTELLDEDDENSQIWNGVNARTLKAFIRLIKPENKDQVCDHFLALQAMGSPSIRQDIRELRHALANQVRPTYDALKMGLQELADIDLRHECLKLSLPMLHCFGKYDRLVPSVDLIKYWYDNPHANTRIFNKTSHNPFLSEKDDFYTAVRDFIVSIM